MSKIVARVLVAIAALLFFGMPAMAQWQVPNHYVPLGKGTGVVGFGSAAIGTGGRLFIDQGAGADPAFKVVSGDCTMSSAGAISCSGTAGSIAVGTTNVTGGTNGRILFDNSGVLGEYLITGTAGSVVLSNSPTITTPALDGTVTGTGVSQSATASTLAQRDSNANLFINNYLGNATSTVSAGGTTILTNASARYQAPTGSSAQTFQLPDATTLSIGPWFVFNNNSSGSLVITNAGGSTIYTVPAGGFVTVGPTNIGTANGSWDAHPTPPSTVTWGSGTTGLVMNTALSTTAAINAGAASTTAPVFIPQRGASTYGLGGDSTHTTLVAGGVAAVSSTSSGTTIPNLTVTGSFTGTGLVGLTSLASQSADTVVMNASGSSASPTAVAMPTSGTNGCAGAGNALIYNTSTHALGCNTISGTGAAGSDTQVQYNSSGSFAASAGFIFDGTSKATLGVAGTSVGAIGFNNATSGTVTLSPVTGALGTVTLSLPAATDTLVGKATTDTLTNKTFDTAGAGNVFKINGTTITAVTGSGSAVLATSPTLVTPTLGVATATSINKMAITAPATSSTLAVADGKTFTASNSLTVAGTDSTTMTFPGTSSNVLTTGNTATITKGYTLTPNNIGTVSSGTTTLDCTAGNYQYLTNNGAFTLAAPSSDCAITLLITNGASAGAITFSGFTVGSSTGSAFTTTNTNKFVVSVTRVNSVAWYSNYALQ